LANNKLNSGQPLQTLGRYLPHLANLSLQNNLLSRMKDMDYLSGKGTSGVKQKPESLDRLREIVLLGNPIRDEMVKQGKLDGYRQ
jgi:nuclear RNA export factor